MKKKNENKIAPPLPNGEHYSMYDVPKESRWRYCYTCVRYFSEMEAYEYHVRFGHHVRTVEEWNQIQEIARKVDGVSTVSKQEGDNNSPDWDSRDWPDQ